jgi:hypothetical protein
LFFPLQDLTAEQQKRTEEPTTGTEALSFSYVFITALALTCKEKFFMQTNRQDTYTKYEKCYSFLEKTEEKLQLPTGEEGRPPLCPGKIPLPGDRGRGVKKDSEEIF